MQRDSHLSSRFKTLELLEHKHNLFEFRVDGWSAWRVLRNPLYCMSQGLPLAQPVRSNGIRSLQAITATFKLLWLVAVCGRRELLVKTCRSGLRLKQGEGFRDVYFDGLLHRGFSCIKLEEINSPDFDRQAAAACYPSDLDPVVFTFWGRILGMLMPVQAMDYCHHVASLLADEMALVVSPRWLRMRLSTIYWQARLYSLLLARIRPRVVLVSDTGEYALRLACHRRGVRFIELQHGVFDAQHPDAIPLWVKGDAAELVLPDILACRGTYWIDRLASTRQGNDNAAAVGNELIDIARERRRQRTPDGYYNLLLTSQGLDSERLASWIADMVDAAPSTLKWRLSIKLHPVYDMATRAFDIFKDDTRVRVIGGSDQPNVFDLLADADLHLSIASACHFDAAALGVPSIIVPLAGHESMLEAVDTVHISVVAHPAQVWSSAITGLADPASMHRFATPSFVDNLQRLVA